MIADIPIIHQQKEFTPKGYVDLDLAWLSKDEVIVARAKENRKWQEGPVPTMYTKLYLINIKSGEQQQLSFPKNNEVDSKPQVISSFITWYRKGLQGNVWVQKGVHAKPYIWLENVDEVPVFFTLK